MKYLTVVKNDQESKKVEEKIREKIKLEYSKESPDYVIAIGGDGTIIQASHSYPNAIIFGVHTGHLGFYANYDVDKLDELINDINSNTFETLDIEYISCEVIDKNNNVLLLGEALNEVTILTPLRTLILDVNIDGKHFETFRGTGLCVSTTFGSTGYNKSLHGAVVDTSLDAFQLTEIAGINSNVYRTLASPLVLSKNRVIELVNSNNMEKAYITVDFLAKEISDFKAIRIKSSNDKIKMAYHEYEDHLKRIKRAFLK